MDIALSLLFGALVGFSLGALGAGGSILVLPALIYGLGIAEKQSIVLALAIVGTTSLYSSIVHAFHGNVRIGAAALFSVTGFVGAFLGAKLSTLAPAFVLLLCLAVLVLYAGARMYRSAGRPRPETKPAPGASWLRKSAPLLIAGVGVGFLTGFLGVGGGFLIVPALTLVARLPIKHAIGTSLVIISINCLSGLIAYEFQGLDALIILPFLVGSFTMSTFATKVAKKLPPSALKRAFAIFILLLGLVMLVDGVIKLARETPPDESTSAS